MSELAFRQISSQIDMLSYSERIRLLDKIVRTLDVPVKSHAKTTANFDAAFGLWANRDISIEKIRRKVRGRS